MKDIKRVSFEFALWEWVNAVGQLTTGQAELPPNSLFGAEADPVRRNCPGLPFLSSTMSFTVSRRFGISWFGEFSGFGRVRRQRCDGLGC